MGPIQLITNFPEISRATENLICFNNETGGTRVRLCMEIERFEIWLDYAHAQLHVLKIEEGADVLPIRPSHDAKRSLVGTQRSMLSSTDICSSVRSEITE